MTKQLPTEFIGLPAEKLPRHVAIIMDGNGRWAKSKGKTRTTGHREGMKRIISTVRTCSDIGIKYLTLYAFSVENWKRPRTEIDFLFSLLVEFLRREIEELHRNNVKLTVIGEISKIPSTALAEINKGIEKTKNNTGLTLCIALNYGGRQEIVNAAKKLAAECLTGKIKPEDITETLFARKLETADMPDPDLIIRTSGELRMSNFLLYQLAYSEFVFDKTNWPDFDNARLYSALDEYIRRDRRFGGLQ